MRVFRRPAGRSLLQSTGAALVLPLALSLLMLLAPLMPAALRPTAAAAVTQPAAPTSVVAARPPLAAPAEQPASTATSVTSVTSSAALSSKATAPAPTLPATAVVTLPAARPLNAPEAVAGAAKTQSAASPTPPIPTPTPTSPYRLPWPGGEAFTVVQGNNSTFSHQGLEAFAWDFSMPTGSVIEAARAGTVRYVRDDSNAGGDDINVFGWAGNYVVIDHGDGTSALYMHLMYHGALVRVGQQVQQGQPLAYSGSTGFSSGPHLHFMVERTEPGVWYDQSLPVRFADVASNGVPLQNQTVKSENAASSYRQTADVVYRVDVPSVELPRPAAATVPGLVGTGTLAWPLNGSVISPMSAQQPVVLVSAVAGQSVVAADTGAVVFSGTDGPSVSVEIDHGNGDVTLYARLVRALVVPGDIVQRGQPIGIAGQLIAGLPVHVALAVYSHGQPVDPTARFRWNLPPAPPPQVHMPNLVGLNVAQATKALAELPLTLATDPAQPSATVTAGLVQSQQPPAGLVTIHTVIHITPSSGPATPTPLPSATPAPTATVQQPATPAVAATTVSNGAIAAMPATATVSSVVRTLPGATATAPTAPIATATAQPSATPKPPTAATLAAKTAASGVATPRTP
ncbi:MAG TPA: peptidoglycan DD-metalloendopeptidase family protein [Chloroflexota bacterium]|nr:peptidoglycan DD-metalloendopeptidase family protein [Chloroflexota bacterium]